MSEYTTPAPDAPQTGGTAEGVPTNPVEGVAEAAQQQTDPTGAAATGAEGAYAANESGVTERVAEEGVETAQAYDSAQQEPAERPAAAETSEGNPHAATGDDRDDDGLAPQPA